MLRIHLLGSLRVSYHDKPVHFAALPKTLPLWAYLLLHVDQPIPRTTLAYTIWPDVDERTARSNLRRHLYELRRVLPTEPAEKPWLLATNTTVQWNPQADYWLDVNAFTQMAKTSHSAPLCWVEAVALYAGDLLPELYDDWLLFERERLHNLYCDGLAQLVTHLQASHRYAEAVAHAQQLLHHEPLREDMVRQLMTLHHAGGDRASALQVYHNFEKMIRAELAVSPMLETSALYTTMAQQLVPSTNSTPANGTATAAPTLAGTPPYQVAAAPNHNLPVQLTSFVGREEEVSELCLLLTMAETPTRLLTLTATGGSGKTRLAIQVGMRVAPHFRDGLCWVDLSLIMDERLVQQTIMKAMGLSVSPQQGYLHSLREHLRAKEMLLLLDNCEHLIEECAQVAEKLLTHCPRLKILATSREALKVAGEQSWLVPPLSVPTGEAIPPAQELLNYQAIRLFVDRARSALATFQLTPQNAPTIIQICRQLDGMPLAIELAAARMKVLTAQQIAVRLDDRFQLLKTDTRTALPRNQTLRATLDWSYDLLTNEERALLQRLAVFVGGCTVEAVEDLATSEALFAEQMPLDLLTRLIEKSLVVVQQQHDGRRCTLLETIRAYALEKLCLSADEKMVRRRHRDWFLRRAEIIAEGMNGDRQMAWLEEMDLEYENFQSAIAWCQRTPGEAPIGLRFACLMNHAWDRRGDLREGNHVLAQLLAHPENRSATTTRAKALNLRGFFTFLLGDHATALALFREALAIGQALQDERQIVTSCGNLTLLLTGSDTPAQAEPYIEQGLAVARKLNDRKQIYLMLYYESWLAMVQGDRQRSHQLLEESLALMRTEGDLVRLGAGLWRLGHLCWLEGSYANAFTAFQQSLGLRSDLKNRRGIAYAIDGLAWVAAVTGQAPVAAQLFGTTHAHFTAMDTHFHPMEQPAHDAAITEARRALGEQLFNAAWTLGQAMSLEAAASLTHSITPPALNKYPE